VPVAGVRAGIAAGVLAGGAGAILYVFLFLTVAEEGESAPVLPLRRVFTPPSPEPPAQVPRDHPEHQGRGHPRLPVAEILLGGSSLIAGLAILLDQLGVDLRLQVILPGLAATVGIGLTWWLIADRDRPERHQVPRVLGALALVA